MTCFHRAAQSLRRLPADGTGATAIEYALIAALIALAIFSSVDWVGEQNSALVERSGEAVQRAGRPD